MSNTYSWFVDSLDCLPLFDNQTNVVSNVYWRVSATDGNNYASISGVQPLTYVAGSPFTNYSKLTPEVVIGWVKSAIGKNEVNTIQNNLDVSINNLKTVNVITPALPWV